MTFRRHKFFSNRSPQLQRRVLIYVSTFIIMLSQFQTGCSENPRPCFARHTSLGMRQGERGLGGGRRGGGEGRGVEGRKEEGRKEGRDEGREEEEGGE